MKRMKAQALIDADKVGQNSDSIAHSSSNLPDSLSKKVRKDGDVDLNSILNSYILNTDPKVLTKILPQSSHYDQEVILALGNSIAESYKLSSKFFLPKDLTQLENIFKGFLPPLPSTPSALSGNNESADAGDVEMDAIFCLFDYFKVAHPHRNSARVYWVSLCILKLNWKVTVLYKGPQCDTLSPIIVNSFGRLSHFHRAILELFYISHDPDQSKRSVEILFLSPDDGPKSLRNMALIMSEFKNNDYSKITHYFQSRGFCTSEEIKQLREFWYKEMCQKFYNIVVQGLEILLNHPEHPLFKSHLVNLVENSWKFKQVAEGLDFQNFVQILKKEVEMAQNDPHYVIDHDKIEQLKKKIWEDPHLQKSFEEQRNNVMRPVDNSSFMDNDILPFDNEIGCLLGIEKKFPWQMKIFKFIIHFFAARQSQSQSLTNDDPDFNKSIEKFSETFGIQLDKLSNLLDLGNTEQVASCVEEEFVDEVGVDIVNEIEAITPNVEALNLNVDSKRSGLTNNFDTVLVKDIDRILYEYFGKPSIPLNASSEQLRNIYENFYSNNHEATTLKVAIRQVINFRSRWDNANDQNIRCWATEKKGNRNQWSGDRDSVLEALAVLDRANEICTKGHRLRESQILACLLFIPNWHTHNENENTGKLCQVETGEGKTTIVSIVAVMKILLGEKYVDIITSNSVLALEAVNSKLEFYQMLGITVATNNPNSEECIGQGQGSCSGNILGRGCRPCYKADIVIGCISSFQFDYLRTVFEGQETMEGRGFHTLILDEVDSMLIDNGANLAKLSVPFPGMDSLRYIYIKIWQHLCLAHDEQVKRVKEDVRKKQQEVEIEKTELSPTPNQVKIMWSEFNSHLIESSHVLIKEQVEQAIKNDLSNFPMIPHHLQNYVGDSLGRWIDNAIFAKYSCHENHHYCIKRRRRSGLNSNQEDCLESETEFIVVPIDYANTGASLQNTIWSHALHQFVQLNHNLRLTSESLTSCCISNYGYINKYQSSNIFGTTGTLGSEPEMNLIGHMYNVTFSKVPTFKKKQFKEISGIAVKDSMWSLFIAKDSRDKTLKEDRSALIICETIADGLRVEESLAQMKSFDDSLEQVEIKKYFDEDNSQITNEVVKTKQIIIATNIAGRGADFVTDDLLESNGGLHVCLGFYPKNERVKDQAFFRTSRQGRKGTAQLVIRQSELGILSDGRNPKEIHEKIIQMERERIEQLKIVKLPQLYFHDTFFDKFSILCRKLVDLGIDPYVLQDLKEYWAFWTESKEQHFRQILKSKLKSVENAGDGDNMSFNVLMTQLNYIVESQFSEFESLPVVQKIVEEGEIQNNPFYLIQQAESFLQNSKIDMAKTSLEKARQLTNCLDDNGRLDIYYSIHIKLFEISVLKGGVIMTRIKQALAKVLLLDKLITFSSSDYQKSAIEHLNRAKSALLKEINFIQSTIMESKDFHKILIPPPKSHDLRSALTLTLNGVKSENEFYKNLKARLVCLEFYSRSIDSLLEMLRLSISTPGHQGLIIGSRVSNYFQNLDPKISTEVKMRQAVTMGVVDDLTFIGLETIYALRQIEECHQETIRNAQEKLAVGLGAMTTGFLFPPATVATLPLASSLIAEGILEIVQEIILGHLEESTMKAEKLTLKCKLINYAIHLATSGIRVLIHYTGLIEKAIKACQSLISWLRKCPFMKPLCRAIAKCIEKIANILESQLILAKESQSLLKAHWSCETFTGYVDNPKLYLQAGVKGVQDVGKAVLKQVTFTLVEEFILNKSQFESMIKDKLKQFVHLNLVKIMEMNSVLMKILKTQNVDECAEECADEVYKFVKENGPNFLNKLKSWSPLVEKYVDKSLTGFNEYLVEKEANKSKEESKEEITSIPTDGQSWTEDGAIEFIAGILFQQLVVKVEAKFNDGLNKAKEFLNSLGEKEEVIERRVNENVNSRMEAEEDFEEIVDEEVNEGDHIFMIEDDGNNLNENEMSNFINIGCSMKRLED